jgi:cation diffusion facilitator CzcD-associated flavoprotein CzcO
MRLPEQRARKHLRAQVADPELRRKLTPDYSLGCKRILLSDDYFPALTQPHGPNIGTGHNSVLHMFESQANYITAAVSYTRDQRLAGAQPTQAAQAAYTAEVKRMSEGTVWTAGGCQSWYLNANGRNVNIWPGSTFDFRRRTLRFDPAAHLMHRPTQTPVPVPVTA